MWFVASPAWVAVIAVAIVRLPEGALAGRSRFRLGPAIAATSLPAVAGVPILSTISGFNWVTAIGVAMLFPAVRWVLRHGLGRDQAFRQLVRRAVDRTVRTAEAAPALSLARSLGSIAGLALAIGGAYGIGLAGVRLPAPADFDTLDETTRLLGGEWSWDPLASYCAVLSRLAATAPLTVIGVVRLALPCATAIVAADAATRGSGAVHRWLRVALVVAATLAGPWAPASTWVLALMVCIAADACASQARRQRDGRYAVAAVLVGIAQVVSLVARDGPVLSQAGYLEHASATREVLRLARAYRDDEWVLVAPPEQLLEARGAARTRDLADFVARYDGRTADPRFRFDVAGKRLVVFVEKEPFEAGLAAAKARFVVEQPPAYRVPGERRRLAARAMRLCDDYRRTHPGGVEYEDALLRVYRFDL